MKINHKEFFRQRIGQLERLLIDHRECMSEIGSDARKIPDMTMFIDMLRLNEALYYLVSGFEVRSIISGSNKYIPLARNLRIYNT